MWKMYPLRSPLLKIVRIYFCIRMLTICLLLSSEVSIQSVGDSAGGVLFEGVGSHQTVFRRVAHEAHFEHGIRYLAPVRSGQPCQRWMAYRFLLCIPGS